MLLFAETHTIWLTCGKQKQLIAPAGRRNQMAGRSSPACRSSSRAIRCSRTKSLPSPMPAVARETSGRFGCFSRVNARAVGCCRCGAGSTRSFRSAPRRIRRPSIPISWRRGSRPMRYLPITRRSNFMGMHTVLSRTTSSSRGPRHGCARSGRRCSNRCVCRGRSQAVVAIASGCRRWTAWVSTSE